MQTYDLLKFALARSNGSSFFLLKYSQYRLAGDFPYPMGAVYIQLNNSFVKRPITHDYTDPSSSLGVSDKDLCTNSQTVIYG